MTQLTQFQKQLIVEELSSWQYLDLLLLARGGQTALVELANAENGAGAEDFESYARQTAQNLSDFA